MARSGDTDDTLGWANVLRELDTTGENLPPGDGWRTMKEIVKASPWGDNKTRNIVSAGVREGHIKMFQGHASISGRLVRQVWYQQNPTDEN
mgnify:CR=1 FL=1